MIRVEKKNARFSSEYCRERFGEELNTLREDIHAHPELGMEEFRTTSLLKTFLQRSGILCLNLGLKTGVVGILRGKHSGPTIALRADIDALPIKEETGAPFASQTLGVMHACGHDIHACGLMGAAKLLAERLDALHGTVLLIFQPAEEPITGADVILKTGLYDAYKIQATFALHVWPDLPLGTVGITSGIALAAKDAFRVTVRGSGGHGSSPHVLHDPIAAGAEIISAIYVNLNRNIPPFETATVSICRVSAGNCDNVVPDTFTAEGSMRSFTEETRQMVLRRIAEVAKYTAEAYGCTADYEWLSGVPATINAPELEDIARLSATNTVGAQGIVLLPRLMISEDFALYPQPAYYYRVGVHQDGELAYPLHNARFLAPQQAIFDSAALLANSALIAGKMLPQPETN